MSQLPPREEALALLFEFTKSESLRSHALAVEAAMREVARERGADEDLYGLAGLLHDIDYEKWPDPEEHARQGATILRERGYPEPIVTAVLAHNPRHGEPRDTDLKRALYAVDELAGFVVACALVRPGRDIGSLEPPSVLKKLKDKAFARQVDRECIRQGAAEMGVELADLVRIVIAGLRRIAKDLGLSA